MTVERRIGVAENDIVTLRKEVGMIPVLETRLDAQGRELKEMKTQIREGFADQKEETKSTRRALIGFAFTIAAACVAALVGLLTVMPS